MREAELPGGRRGLVFDGQAIELREAGPATLHLSTDRPAELVMAGLDLHGVEVERLGATGVRFRDPYGNLVEITFAHRHPICGTALRAIENLRP